MIQVVWRPETASLSPVRSYRPCGRVKWQIHVADRRRGTTGLVLCDPLAIKRTGASREIVGLIISMHPAGPEKSVLH